MLHTAYTNNIVQQVRRNDMRSLKLGQCISYVGFPVRWLFRVTKKQTDLQHEREKQKKIPSTAISMFDITAQSIYETRMADGMRPGGLFTDHKDRDRKLQGIVWF